MRDPEEAHTRRGAPFTFDAVGFNELVQKLKGPVIKSQSAGGSILKGGGSSSISGGVMKAEWVKAPSFDHAVKVGSSFSSSFFPPLQLREESFCASSSCCFFLVAKLWDAIFAPFILTNLKKRKNEMGEDDKLKQYLRIYFDMERRSATRRRRRTRGGGRNRNIS